MGNYVQVDKAKDVFINEEGKLLLNGTRPLTPDLDEETELKAFQVRSDKAIGEKDTRFVHVEVYRHFGDTPSCPKLDAEDVVFLDEKKRNPYHIHNLALSDSGREKVFGGESEDSGEKAKVKSEKVTDESLQPDDDEGTGSGGDGGNGTLNTEHSTLNDEVAQGDKGEIVDGSEEEKDGESGQLNPDDQEEESIDDDEGADEEAPSKVFEADKRGGYYDILDPATGDSILADFGRDKLLRKSDIPDFAEEHSIEVNIP